MLIRNTKDHRERGFTLLELMITVAIIGILAGIALPAYNDYILKGKLAEAFANLADVQNKMEQYYQDNRTYASSGTTCGIPNPTGQNFTYSCTASATGQGFTATATGQNSASGFVFTVNEAGTKATTTVPSGWTAQANCWVRSKGGC